MSLPTAPRVGISLMLDDAFRGAVLPLFESGRVEVLEWSFEVGWADSGEPGWASTLLDHYADQGRLWGHGVTFSLLSADRKQRQAAWLERVALDCGRRSFLGVSEHYGFMGNDDFDVGAPLPMPPSPIVAQLGGEALQRLAAATGCPVGVENLALAFSETDVWAQGPTIATMIENLPNGYVVLDLHNLYCQAENYGVDGLEVAKTYPLDRVRCMHVSGGSWSRHAGRRFRRDTHDGPVPDGVFALLSRLLPRCPKLEAVILERIGGSIRAAGDAEGFGRDYDRLVREVQG